MFTESGILCLCGFAVRRRSRSAALAFSLSAVRPAVRRRRDGARRPLLVRRGDLVRCDALVNEATCAPYLPRTGRRSSVTRELLAVFLLRSGPRASSAVGPVLRRPQSAPHAENVELTETLEHSEARTSTPRTSLRSRETPNCVHRLSRLGIEALDFHSRKTKPNKRGKLASGCPGAKTLHHSKVFEL